MRLRIIARRALFCAVAVSALAGLPHPSSATLTVWVEFDATWETNVDLAATAAGVATFTAGEKVTIQTAIVTELERIYDDYDVTFTPAAADPGGLDMRLDLGASTGSPGLFGDAPVLMSLWATHAQMPSIFGPGTYKANTYAANFGFTIEAGDPRATQMSELSIALAGTAAHELAHSLGLLHHHAYGNEGIDFTNYGATAGIQNTAIMGTGSTGLTEAGRESLREFGKWERALLDTTGGHLFSYGGPIGFGTGESIVPAPIITDFESGDGSLLTDIGSTAGTAQPLLLAPGSTSGLLLAYVTGALQDIGGPPDSDWYSVTLPGPGTLTVDVWSASWGTSATFNPMVTIIAPDGITPIFGNDNAFYSGDVFGAGAFGSTQSFIANFPIFPGTFYLAISPVGPADIGDIYSLIIGFDADELTSAATPEPATLTLSLLGLAVFALARRRRS